MTNHVTSGLPTALARRAVKGLYKQVSDISTAIVSDDGLEVLAAVASAWTHPARYQPVCLNTRRQNHPHWLSHVIQEHDRSH